MPNYCLFYDADCPICTREMALLRTHNPSGNLHTLPVQGNEALLAAHGVSREDALTLIHILTPDHRIISGMPALRLAYAQCQGRFFTRVWNLPGLRQLADRLYPHIARNRYRLPRWLLPRPTCSNNQCRRSP